MAATKNGKSLAWARWLETERKAQKLSQRKLADRSGGTVSAAQIQRWETGAEATVEDVINTCAALVKPVTAFLVAAGYVDPDQVGIPVRYRSVAGMPKRDLIALRRELDNELDERIPDDQAESDDLASVSHLAPFFRPDAPVVNPDTTDGGRYAALDRRDDQQS